MISLISYLGESWRERRSVVLKNQKNKKTHVWKQIGNKASLTHAACGRQFPKMAPQWIGPPIIHASWTSVSLNLTGPVTSFWPMKYGRSDPMWLLKLVHKKIAPSSWVSWNTHSWDIPPRNPAALGRHTGAPVGSWVPSQHQLQTLWMSCLALSAQLRFQTTSAAIWLQQDEVV